MASYDNSNSGFLMRDSRHQEGDKRPEFTGSLNVNGVEYRLAAWVRTSKAGKKFFSLKISPKDEPRGPREHAQAGTEPDIEY